MNIGIDVDDTISNSFETIFADSQKFDIELGNSGEPNNMEEFQTIIKQKLYTLTGQMSKQMNSGISIL